MSGEREVLVAIDSGEASERVVEFVNRFFGRLDVRITAVNIGTAAIPWSGYLAAPGLLYPWPYGTAAVAPGPGAGPGSADAVRDEAAATLAESGIVADEQVVELGGDVAAELRSVAASREVDLVVVGASDKGLLERLFSPSVTSDLVRSASVPVLVVH